MPPSLPTQSVDYRNFFRSVLVRNILTAFLCATKLPILLACVLAASRSSAGHTVYIDFTGRDTQITLCHTHGAAGHGQGHSWIEKLLVGESGPQEPQDHHIRLGSEFMEAPEDGMDADLLPRSGAPCPLPHDCRNSVTSGWHHRIESPAVTASLVDPHPPQDLRKGVILRI